MIEHRNQGINKTEKISACKPDYEQMIIREKKQLEFNTNFQNAIFEYMGDGMLIGKMAELVGELVSK